MACVVFVATMSVPFGTPSTHRCSNRIRCRTLCRKD
jgi:hypothetical protein